jgi:hypothetical protein
MLYDPLPQRPDQAMHELEAIGVVAGNVRTVRRQHIGNAIATPQEIGHDARRHGEMRVNHVRPLLLDHLHRTLVCGQ